MVRSSPSGQTVAPLRAKKDIKLLALAAVLGTTLCTGAHAAYLPPPQVGDAYSLSVDLEADGTPDFSTTLTVTSGVSGTQNSTLAPFSVLSSGRTFTFGSTAATWFFDAVSTLDDGIAAVATSIGCSAGALPCSMSIDFARTYDGSVLRTIGDSDNRDPISYTRLTGQSTGQVPEPGMLLLLATALGLTAWFSRRRL